LRLAHADTLSVIRTVAAGIVGLGLVGGAASVVYDNGDATVTITNPKTGQTQSVTITGDDGRTFSCPSGTREKVEPMIVTMARIDLTLQKVRSQIRRIENEYPGHVAPGSVIAQYEALALRDKRLVTAYNDTVGQHNAVIDRDCTPEG
jgi:hypothetical protein